MSEELYFIISVQAYMAKVLKKEFWKKLAVFVKAFRRRMANHLF